MRSFSRIIPLRLLALAVLALGPACDGKKSALEEVCCQSGTRFFVEVVSGGVCEIGNTQVEARLCETVCCDRNGGLFETTSAGECASIIGRQTDPALCAAKDAGAGGGDAGGGDAGGGETSCTCDQAASFEIVSGCEGAAFSDATTASFCRSAVEFVVKADPATHLIVSGTVLGFEECQVRVTCP